MMKKITGIVCVLVLFACSSQKKNATNTTTVSAYPVLSAEDDSIYTRVERATFNYFWDGAEPTSGMARERLHLDNEYGQNDKNIVTIGGGGFGVMSILAAMERHFITREQGFERLKQITGFLQRADRFHGAWPHWLHGETGKVKPFGQKDDGGDLVETSFMLQGLLAVRQYFKDGNPAEQQLARQIDMLWREVDFDWYRNGKNVLYWHWSPNYAWEKNFPVTGYNECLIMYILAASSPTHGVPAEVYHEGWAQSGKIKDTNTTYGYTRTLAYHGSKEYGGPLFWAHYSYLGLDPHGLKDRYADYWQNNVSHTMIDYQWCVENPKHFKGYGADSWGLTASYSVKGYAAHAPGEKRDLGVIAPTAALSSMPYSPQQSMQAMRHWYKDMGDKLFGAYGFYDAFSETANWFPPRYLAIDQGPVVVMMENYRSGLLWKLFMSCDEVQQGLKKLGFQSPYLK